MVRQSALETRIRQRAVSRMVHAATQQVWQSVLRYSDAYAVYNAYIKNGKRYVPLAGSVYVLQRYQPLYGINPTGHAVI